MFWQHPPPVPGELNSRSKALGKKLCAELIPAMSQAEKLSVRIQVTGVWQRAARDDPGDVEAVQAQEIIQPLLHGVPRRVPDGLVQGHLVQRASCRGAKDTQGWTSTPQHPCALKGS